MKATGLVKRPTISRAPPTSSRTAPIHTWDHIGGLPPPGMAIGHPKSLIVPACMNMKAATMRSTLRSCGEMLRHFASRLDSLMSSHPSFDHQTEGFNGQQGEELARRHPGAVRHILQSGK